MMPNQMQCIKTGCHLYLRSHGQSYIGDLYFKGSVVDDIPTGPGFYVFKYTKWRFEPIRPLLNCIVRTADADYEDRYFAGGMMAFDSVEWYSYAGEPLTPV